jgi:Rrf2 family transcriptional regulator, iron-sulfur cluster assembly transcription factor
MITKEADYAIRVMLYLAHHANNGQSVSTARLSEEMDIPYRFLRKIVRRMVEAGLVASQRGKGGGVKLARPRDRISLLEVVSAIDPRGVQINTCSTDRRACARSRRCEVHPELRQVQQMLDKHLGDISFEQLALKKANAAKKRD